MTFVEQWEAEAEGLKSFLASASPDGLRAAQRLLSEEIERRADGLGARWRTKVMPVAWYGELDAGIRFPVRVLHAAGIETCQSCQGGAGHAYSEPAIDLVSGSVDATGFQALAALANYGVDVLDIALRWGVVGGLPMDRVWRVLLRRAYWERANEVPIFVHGYIASAP